MSSDAKKTVAIMYDFDKTLCTKDMQEYTFIPNLGMTAEEFWQEASALAEQNKMDRILGYMYLMIKKAKREDKAIRREDFVKLGKDIEFYPGVTNWFEHLNDFAKDQGVKIEHYIISSGLKEIIEGSKLKNKFEEIYASEFLYDVNNVAIWPRNAINYTAKTQFLFRINKGILDISEDDALNNYIDNDERRIPFRNMIYIGDGLTDVPCMKLVKLNGGYSIAVYKQGQQSKVKDLLINKRVDFLMPADYSSNKQLYKTVTKMIQKMAVADDLYDEHFRQLKMAKDSQEDLL
ncbi:MAG TPA: haloacid dehalogenase-like hydrolase [Candidatus Avacidaminococcus intestinavium]|uniref:Haloacid dehalogenase-like hydrolase n=1 Tax=Candidatus Avacidaminococcus intestinavium TaxID=2840684 RepID=A0A9D1MP77_9FIRM|nr:haloacid dehalogenase-like hydrolase [Candidatus Avacidaminococcus intestinavium]